MENVKHKHREGKMIVLENGELKIKSTELVDIINDFRKVEAEAIGRNYTELRHNDFMTKIKKELEVLKKLGVDNQRNFSLVKYLDKKGENRPCFELNRDGMLQMLNSESALVRYKTIEYINKLEDQVKGQTRPLTTEETLELQFKFTREVRAEVKELRDDFTEYKETTPLFTVECKELQALVRKKGVEVLGGKGSQAYIDNSLRGKVYADIQHQLKREFQVTKYEAIKRGQFVTAKEIVANYRVPTGLKEEIIKVNNQIDFKNAI